jgi:hypothetical protein
MYKHCSSLQTITASDRAAESPAQRAARLAKRRAYQRLHPEPPPSAARLERIRLAKLERARLRAAKAKSSIEPLAPPRANGVQEAAMQKRINNAKVAPNPTRRLPGHIGLRCGGWRSFANPSGGAAALAKIDAKIASHRAAMQTDQGYD